MSAVKLDGRASWDVRRALSTDPKFRQTLDVPCTEFIPPGCWVTSAYAEGSALHLVDWAVAVWSADVPRLGARAICGTEILHPAFSIEPPGDGDALCDGCALADFERPIVVYRLFDVSFTCVEYPTQAEALVEEGIAICTEWPRFNRSLRAQAPRSRRMNARPEPPQDPRRAASVPPDGLTPAGRLAGDGGAAQPTTSRD